MGPGSNKPIGFIPRIFSSSCCLPIWYTKTNLNLLGEEEEEEEKMAICMCCDSHLVSKSTMNPWNSPKRTKLGFVLVGRRFPATTIVKASAVDSPESSSNFAKRMDQAWIISQQPSPVGCSSCNSKGHVECKWCAGTGFFILGDNMLCQVPSRNTSCVICSGQGSASCSDCKGTGFRAKWLEKPPVPT